MVGVLDPRGCIVASFGVDIVHDDDDSVTVGLNVCSLERYSNIECFASGIVRSGMIGGTSLETCRCVVVAVVDDNWWWSSDVALIPGTANDDINVVSCGWGSFDGVSEGGILRSGIFVGWSLRFFVCLVCNVTLSGSCSDVVGSPSLFDVFCFLALDESDRLDIILIMYTVCKHHNQCVWSILYTISLEWT